MWESACCDGRPLLSGGCRRRSLQALQQPNWPDDQALAANLEVIKKSPPLVFAGACAVHIPLQHSVVLYAA